MVVGVSSLIMKKTFSLTLYLKPYALHLFSYKEQEPIGE